MFKKKLLTHLEFLLRHRAIFGIVAFFIVLFTYSFVLKHTVETQYNTANTMMEKGDYDGAVTHFQLLGDYKDSVESLCVAQNHVDYDSANKLLQQEKYLEAAQAFEQLGEFQDSSDLALKARYQYAIGLFQAKKYNEATLAFQELGDYEDSALYVAKIALALYEDQQKKVYNEAYKLYTAGEYQLALEDFESLKDYLDSEELAEKCKAHIKRNDLSTTISAGIRYSVAITEDNKTISTGYNEDGQSNVSDWENIVSVSAKGIYTIGLKSDGTIVTAPEIPNLDNTEWTDIVAVSAGQGYFVGLKGNGSLVSYGHDAGDGQRKVDSWENIVAIATGWKHTVGLDKDGKVLITGYGASSQLRQISNQAEEWENIVAIAAGAAVIVILGLDIR